jgi:hypothetical protein
MNNKYKEEVIKKWGNTSSYKEYEEKSKNYSNDKLNNIVNELNSILKEFSFYMNSGFTSDSNETQNLVLKLKNHITNNFYNCTDEILYNLGQMYVSDERFKNNIDKNGINTSEYIKKSIEFFCLN